MNRAIADDDICARDAGVPHQRVAADVRHHPVEIHGGAHVGRIIRPVEGDDDRPIHPDAAASRTKTQQLDELQNVSARRVRIDLIDHHHGHRQERIVVADPEEHGKHTDRGDQGNDRDAVELVGACASAAIEERSDPVEASPRRQPQFRELEPADLPQRAGRGRRRRHGQGRGDVCGSVDELKERRGRCRAGGHRDGIIRGEGIRRGGEDQVVACPARHARARRGSCRERAHVRERRGGRVSARSGVEVDDRHVGRRPTGPADDIDLQLPEQVGVHLDDHRRRSHGLPDLAARAPALTRALHPRWSRRRRRRR